MSQCSNFCKTHIIKEYLLEQRIKMQCKKTHTLKNWYTTMVTYFSKLTYKLSPYHIKQG